MGQFISYKSWLNEAYTETFYHGSTDKSFAGKKGIHVGTYKAAKQALEARIGVPAEGEWDGTREYGKTLLAGGNRLKDLHDKGIFCETGYNCNWHNNDRPDEDYYPTERPHRATYSDKTPIPFDCKPIIFPVKIVGPMTNWQGMPHSDERANAMMSRNLKMGNARRGYYYENIAEDEGSISAVVPDGSFLQTI